MNRRSFISAILAAAVSPSVLVAGAQDRFRWKGSNWKKIQSGLWVLNPGWEKAEYEMRFVFEKGCFWTNVETGVLSVFDGSKWVPLPEDDSRPLTTPT